jgi:hypothetical protein
MSIKGASDTSYMVYMLVSVLESQEKSSPPLAYSYISPRFLMGKTLSFSHTSDGNFTQSFTVGPNF